MLQRCVPCLSPGSCPYENYPALLFSHVIWKTMLQTQLFGRSVSCLFCLFINSHIVGCWSLRSFLFFSVFSLIKYFFDLYDGCHLIIRSIRIDLILQNLRPNVMWTRCRFCRNRLPFDRFWGPLMWGYYAHQADRRPWIRCIRNHSRFRKSS